MTPEEALRHIHEAFNDQDGSYWADAVLRAVRDTLPGGTPSIRVRGVRDRKSTRLNSSH